MCDIGSIEFDSFDDDYLGKPFPSSSSVYDLKLHDAIFFENSFHSFTRQVTLPVNFDTANRINKIFLAMARPQGGAKVNIKGRWGGKDGFEWSAGIEADIHDKNGNRIEVEIEQNADGTGSGKVSAGYDNKD